MPKIKNNASGQISDVDQTTIDQIKANPSLSQNYTFIKDEGIASTPPEVQEQGTVKKDEGQGQDSPISSPDQQGNEQSGTTEVTKGARVMSEAEADRKASNKNSKK